MTLDLYGHLFADQLDQVADALDAARSSAKKQATRTNRPRIEVVNADGSPTTDIDPRRRPANTQ